MSNGAWIYYTYAAYSEALSKIEESTGEQFDATKDELSSKKIEKKNSYDWIKEEAEKDAVANLTIEKLIKDEKVKIDEDEADNMVKQYKSYYEMGEDFYKNLGISADTFGNINGRYPYLSNELFYYLYGKDGPKEVKDADLKKYFEENYTDYYFISYALTQPDDDGNTVDIDADTKDKVTANFAKYATALTKGEKSTADIDNLYMEDFEVDSSPSQKGTTILDENSGVDEEVRKAIADLKEGTATVKDINSNYYLLYKGKIKEKSKKISDDSDDEDAISRKSVLYRMKSDDYKDYLEKEEKKLKYETNDACIEKYSVERTVGLIIEDEKKSNNS